MNALDYIKSTVVGVHPAAKSISDYVRGKSSETERVLIEAHFRDCHVCRAHRDTVAAIIEQTEVPPGDAVVVPFALPHDPDDGPCPPSGQLERHNLRRPASFPHLLAADDSASTRRSGDVPEYDVQVEDAEGGAIVFLRSNPNTAALIGSDPIATRIAIGDAEFSLSLSDDDPWQVIDGLTREHMARWMALGRPGGWRVLTG